MIRYALVCDAGHAFESWFGDSAAFEVQRDRGLVECPSCSSKKVDRQIMAPAVVSRGMQASAEAMQPVAMAAQTTGGPDREMREMLRAFKRHVEANSEDVGTQFAEEARKIHFGEVDARAIRGEATPSDVKALREEGVEIAPLPVLPDDLN